jgi:hypothetical protein
MRNGTRVVNDIGCGLLAPGAADHVRGLRVFEEGGSVQVWVETDSAGINDVLQYLTPAEAMVFAKAFERCAIAALKNGC